MPFGLTDDDIKQVRQVFHSFPHIATVTLFGSRAMGNYKRGSDIDLALKGDAIASLVTQVSAKLNEEIPLPYFFDVIDYHTITNAELRHHIDRYGQVLYTR
ncbi:MAG: nucleotidyltransferase domain-containing protein [Deltaproteobacteria bacterium]|nr:nucleotidyltransferase domain-containing protein [Deltaproteobacteria bacterium]